MAIYWDDELTTFNGTGHGSGGATTGGFNPLPIFPEPVWDNPNTPAPNDGWGIPGTQPMTVDTSIALSGTSSLRYNYTGRCQVTDGSAGVQPCGGSTSRNFGVYAPEHYGRIYIRISANFQWAAVNGQSKIFGVRSTQGVSKMWFNFYFSLGVIASCENTPVTGSTSNIPKGGSLFTMPRETWTCFEWRIKANDPPGTANGELQTWVNNVQTFLRTDISWRGPGNNSYLDFFHFYRQNGGPAQGDEADGIAHIWFDRVAIGNTRIGLVGGPAPDTTPPPVPSAPTITSGTGLPATYQWPAVTNPGDLAGYNIYRRIGTCGGGGSDIFVGAVANVLTYTDTTIPAGTTDICVKIASRDTSGNVSALSTGAGVTLVPVSQDTFANVNTITVDTTGADITFLGLAHKLRYWNDLHPRGSEVELAGLGSVATYRLSKVWEPTISYVCMEAQGADGIWETTKVPASYLCKAVTPGSADTTPPATPVGLQFA